jgi:hypothetical protein
MRRAIVAVWILGMTCLIPEANAGDSALTFVSDATWLASSQLQDGSLGQPLGDAQCICFSGGCPCCWTSNTGAIPGACWLWKPGTSPSTVPVDLEGVYLAKIVEVPGYPDAGVLYFAADDFAEVRVNGTLVRTIGSTSDYGSAAGAQAQLTQVVISAYIVPGPNEILVHVQNGPGSFTGTSCNPCSFGQNPTGAIVGGSISYFAAVPVKRWSWGSLKTIYR